MEREAYRFGSVEDRLRSVVHSIGLIVGSYLVGIVLTLVAFTLLRALGATVGDSVETLPVWANVLSTSLQFIGFYFACLAYLRWRSEGSLFEIGVPSLRDVGWVGLTFVGLLVGVNVITAALAQFGVTPATNAVIEQGERAPEYFLYLIPIALLLNGPAEELLFRGLIQGLFRRAYGVVPGIVLASVLFGAVHITAVITTGGGTASILATLGTAGVLGLVLGAVYERTRNLLVPMVAHGVYNAVLFYVNYLRVTGQITVPS